MLNLRAINAYYYSTHELILTFDSVDEIPESGDSNENYWAVFAVVLFIMLYNVVLTFDSLDEILESSNSNENYWAVLCCGAVYYAV